MSEFVRRALEWQLRAEMQEIRANGYGVTLDNLGVAHLTDVRRRRPQAAAEVLPPAGNLHPLSIQKADEIQFKIKPGCKTAGCVRPVKCRGFCKVCYNREFYRRKLVKKA